MNKKLREKFFEKLLAEDSNTPNNEETKEAFEKGAVLVCMNEKVKETIYSAKCDKCRCKVYYGEQQGKPKKFFCNDCFSKMLENDEEMQINIPQDTIRKIAECLEKKENAIAG